MKSENEKCGCCKCYFPNIPRKWLLFMEFAFTLGTTIVFFADIVTDIVTLQMYYREEWYYAFGLSIFFIVVPSIIVAVQEYLFLRKTHGKQMSWCSIFLRTILNIPFQLTVIWYHIKLSSSYFKVWADNFRGIEQKNSSFHSQRQSSLSNLADVDDRQNTVARRSIELLNTTVYPAAPELQNSRVSIAPAAGANDDKSWWKQLTREQWLSHLNKVKLSESMLESLPQLMINLYLILSYPEKVAVIQYISACLSYLSLCGGVVRYDKTRKDNEAERWMVDRTLLHSRSFQSRLEWPQVLFLSLYKGSFLAARILAIVYFSICFTWYILIAILVHWVVYLGYLVWKWFPRNLEKITKRLDQADYKYRAYMFLSQDFMSVFESSLLGIFIHIRTFNNMFYVNSYCFIFWFYFIYVTENLTLFIIPGLLYTIWDQESELQRYEYYAILGVELFLNVAGVILCVVYYFLIHKMHIYTQNAYSNVTKLFDICFCRQCSDFTSVYDGWTVCKQAETSEVFYLRRSDLEEFKSNYTTIVRSDRRIGRNLEMFIDDRGCLFYAPRDKLFKKIHDDGEEFIDEESHNDSSKPDYPLVTQQPLHPLSSVSSTNANVSDIISPRNNKVPGVAFSVSLTQSIHDPDSDPEMSLENIEEVDEDAFTKDVNTTSKPNKLQRLLKGQFKSSKDNLASGDRSQPAGQVPQQPVSSMWV